MREDLVPLLRSPDSGQPLTLASVERFFVLPADVAQTGDAGEAKEEPSERRFVVDGILQSPEGERFPIMQEIPRLVPRGMLSEEENAYLESQNATAAEDPWQSASLVEPEVVTEQELEAEIRRRMEGQYRLPARDAPHDEQQTQARRRCEGEIRYMTAEARGHNKRKYVGLLKPHIERGGEVGSILETGGNFPGLTRNLAAVYAPGLSVVANIQILFPKAFLTADRSIGAVRADVQALPFADDSFDLVVTAFMLEHVPDWRRGLLALMRVGRRVFIAFGPNKWFPFEVGHLDAPLAGMLPKALAARVAWLWLLLIGRRRPLRRLREILDEVFHVGSGSFARQAKRNGGRPQNLFPHLVEGIIADADAPPTGPRRWLKRFPKIAVMAARTLTALGLEPQMYYWIEKPSSRR